MRREFGAVCVSLGVPNDRIDRRVKAALGEQAADKLPLPYTLSRDRNMLKLTPAALRIVHAARFHSVRRGGLHADEIRVGVTITAAEDSSNDGLADESKWHRDADRTAFPREMADAKAFGAQLSDNHADLFVVGKLRRAS